MTIKDIPDSRSLINLKLDKQKKMTPRLITVKLHETNEKNLKSNQSKRDHLFSTNSYRFIPKYIKIVYEVQNAPDKTQNLKKYFYK